MFNKQSRWFLAGLAFAIFWSSAATATKIGLMVAQPMVIATIRFAAAALLMLFISHLMQKNKLPQGKEWIQVSIYGALNISIYLGLYIIAMQQVTAGIGSLSVAINPVLISFFSVFLLNKKLSRKVIIALVICTCGIICAAWPLIQSAKVTTWGMAILFLSMLSYALAAIYFSSKNWGNLNLLTINGWQTCIGGVLLLPFALFFYEDKLNQFNSKFWGSVFWLAVPVSIGAVQLWLWLLKTNPIRAGLWLFLCPLFGFIIAVLLANESFSWFTLFGLSFVLMGLFIARSSTE